MPVIHQNSDERILHSTSSYLGTYFSPGDSTNRFKMLAILPSTETHLPGPQTKPPCSQPPPNNGQHPLPPPSTKATAPPPKPLHGQRTPPAIPATNTTPPPTLLTIPLEFRLQIYTHLLHLHLLPPTSLPADYPPPPRPVPLLLPRPHHPPPPPLPGRHRSP